MNIPFPEITGVWNANYPLYIKLQRVKTRDVRMMFRNNPHTEMLVGYPTVTYRTKDGWRVWPLPCAGVSLVYAKGRNQPHSICIEATPPNKPNPED